MLNFPFQFHTCLKLFYCPILSRATTHTNAYVSTHNVNNWFSIVLLSQPKHSVPSIGSTGFHESKVPSVDFGLCEEEEEYDDGDDVVVEGRERVGASFVSREDEKYPPWGEVELEEGDDGVEGWEEFDTSFVSKKNLPPWGEVELEDDDERIEDFNAYSVAKKELSFWGEVEGGDDVEGKGEFDTFFLSKKELPPWKAAEVDEDDDNDDINGGGDNDVEGRADGDAIFVAKKELPPWGEIEDDGDHDTRPAETTLSASGGMRLIKEDRPLFLEELDENVLSNRILVLSRTNKIRSAMEYFRSMELFGLSPNIHACNSLISSLLRNGWFDDCFKVFHFTRTKRIATGHTYSLILMAHEKAHGCNAAIRFFRELESECDVEKDFDAIVYNTMISICRNVDSWSEIERLWRSMKTSGCTGTHVTYRLLINSFLRCDQTELALYVYHEMVQNGFEPDSTTLNAIISVCAKDGKWDAALSIFQKTLKGELKPNLVACNALINSLGRAGELKLAFHVYDTMKSLDHKPDLYTFNALLSSLSKANRHHKVLQLFGMIERNQTSRFNIHLYNTVLMSCSKLRLWDKAIEILWRMEASGLSDLTRSYNLVIRTCELARNPRIALQVYKHMVHQKCSPNIFTYLSMIRCCVRGDLWEELEEILNQTMPNTTLYNAAVQGMCLRGNVKLANKVYTKMLDSGFQPEVKTQVLMLRMTRK
ncbi:hypothetical protein RJT34_18472 [Clitoria ternatea]|uniref:Pentatricopeptide repeat-containing protein n=1 Tax=Clitoria ternatea TaxID=43366 RepID=A0AAN9PFV4_CLITE